jgi:hypothetical protein
MPVYVYLQPSTSSYITTYNKVFSLPPRDYMMNSVYFGETWRRLLAKIVLWLAGSEAKETCGIDQLCTGLEAGIEGGIHVINQLWKEYAGHNDLGISAH